MPLPTLIDTGPSPRGWHPRAALVAALETRAFTEAEAVAIVRAFFLFCVDLPPETRRIPLSSGAWAIVDAADFEWLCQWKWSVSVGPRGRAVAMRQDPERGGVLMHTELLPVARPLVVDHINGNSLDNRRANLRAATIAQNGANSRRKSRQAHGFKGIYFDKARGCWCARIKVNYRERALGRFSTAEEAARAYDRAAIEAWGAHARLNFPAAERR